MVRYSNSADAPKLLATAIALGINGITNASAENLKVKAIRDLQDKVSTWGLAELNYFFETFGNKVLLQTIFQRVQFKDPISKAFFREGINFSNAKEIIDAKLLESHPFDRDRRYPRIQTKAKALNVILSTVVREYITNTVPLDGFQGAFTSELVFGAWMTKQIDLIAESFQKILYDDLAPRIADGVKNTVTLDAKINSWDKIFIEVNRISARMANIPTDEYNLAYQNDDNDKDKKRVQIVPRGDMYIVGSTDTMNSLEGEVQTVKYHNAYFKIKGYKGFIAIDVENIDKKRKALNLANKSNPVAGYVDKKLLAPAGKGVLYLVAKNAFEGYFRVNRFANQHWASNLTMEYFLHYWYVFGAIFWANAVKIVYTLPGQANSRRRRRSIDEGKSEKEEAPK